MSEYEGDLYNVSNIFGLENICKNKLDEDILRGIYSKGFDNLNEFQEKLIPQILSSDNFLFVHKYEIGKTFSLIIRSMYKINREISNPQILIITQESEIQSIYSLIKELSYYTEKIFDVYKVESIDLINENDCPILVKTWDDLNSNLVSNPDLYTHISSIFIDLPELTDDIISKLIVIKNKLSIKQYGFALNSLKNYHYECLKGHFGKLNEFVIKEQQFTLCGDKHSWINLQNFNIVHKPDILLDIVQKIFNPLVIYIDDSKELEQVVKKLAKNNFEYQIISNRKTRLDDSKRIYLVNGILRYELNYSINIIINYNVEQINEIELYTQRVGRTGCFGRKRLVINFVQEPELFNQIMKSNQLVLYELEDRFLDEF